MKIFDRYLGGNVLLTTFFGIAILSFFLVLGNFARDVLDLLVNQNLPWGTALYFAALFLPVTLTFTIPWAFLAALLLVFGRISADHELVGLQASGVSLFRICAPVFLLALAFAGVCLWINLQASPRARQQMFSGIKEIANSNPVALFPVDEVIDSLEGRRIYIGRRDGDTLRAIRIFEMDDDGLLTRAIFAREGVFLHDPQREGLTLRLRQVRFEERNKTSADILGMRPGLMMGEGTYQVFPRKFAEANRRGNAVSARTYSELRSLLVTAQGPEKLRATLEWHRRFSLAGACIAFALIAVPLGITAHRRESVVGFGISIVLAFTYYLLMMLAQTFAGNGLAASVFLTWLPNILFVLLGGALFLRVARR